MDTKKSPSKTPRSDLELQPWMSFDQAGKNFTGWQAAQRFREYEFDRYLDVGCGKHREHHKMIGKFVITTDLFPPADFQGDYQEIIFPDQYPALWCNHVLEHQLNPHAFLEKIYRDLETRGVLCITVPPAHPEMMGGHVSLWTEGLLVYRLILAGFDCSQSRVGVYDRNISVIVKKKPIKDFSEIKKKLVYDNGDIDLLAPYFPVKMAQGISGKFGNVNW